MGMAVGVYQQLHFQIPEKGSCGGSSCTQGFIEQLTKVKLPPLASLIANLAVTWCHIHCHPRFFVPIVGGSLGAWAGQRVAI
jgi:hypothetical protein